MTSLRFTSRTTSDGVVERDFTVGEVPGVLWSPAAGPDHAPVVLMGHGGGLHKKTPAQRARAVDAVTKWGFHVVAIDAPGHGERLLSIEDEQVRDEFKQAMKTGDIERFRKVSVGYALSLAERAVPEWQQTLDAVQELPEIGTEAPIGYGGGISLGTAIGIPLVAADSRISAAIFGGGFFAYEEELVAARHITVPVLFLLPWDDQYVDRRDGLALFDAFASKEKTLHANPGDHRTIRWHGVDDGFLARHLG
jgi:alpha-beta hydrolase superfamily lysophospholipase